MVRPPSTRSAFVLAMLAGLSAACGGDACDGSTGDRCEGDVVWTCRTERDGFAVDYEWAADEDCAESSRVCVFVDHDPGTTPSSHAFCAESSEPSAICEAVMPSGAVCDGDVLVSCLLGYVTARTDCAACQDGACSS